MSVMSRRRVLRQTARAVGILSIPPWTFARADQRLTAADLTAKGVAFLRQRHGADGSWSADRKEPGITALVVTAMLRSGRITADDPAIRKGLAYLEQFIGPNGGLSESPHSVYALAKRQEPSGGWVNRDDRFMEGDANIVTAYSLLALAHLRAKA